MLQQVWDEGNRFIEYDRAKQYATVDMLKTMLADAKADGQRALEHERSERAALQLKYDELQTRINDRVLPSTRVTVTSDSEGATKVRERSPRWSNVAAELERESREKYWKNEANRATADIAKLGPAGSVSVGDGPGKAPASNAGDDSMGA